MKRVDARKEIVLIVDDNPSSLKGLIDFLSNQGMEIWIALNGEDALRRVSYAKPDIILLDILMPGIDGFETCRYLKEKRETQDIPIIFLTAVTDIEDKLKGFNLGAVDYIIKPYEKEEVLIRIQKQLAFFQQKKELSFLISRLTESNALKDEFFSVFAHDMRESLNVLLGFSKPLYQSMSGFNKDKVELFASYVYHSAKNTFKLVENLIEWSKIQSGNLKFNPITIDLNAIIPENIGIFQKDIKRKQLTVTHSILPNTLVYSDVKMIYTIFYHILSNAIKYTPDAGKITISATPKGQFVTVAISDSGIGIIETNKHKLFNISQKYSKKGTSGEEGTGMGLIICKALVEKNSGQIWFESIPGQGTTFYFTLVRGTHTKKT